jgi:hypothetical protein
MSNSEYLENSPDDRQLLVAAPRYLTRIPGSRRALTSFARRRHSSLRESHRHPQAIDANLQWSMEKVKFSFQDSIHDFPQSVMAVGRAATFSAGSASTEWATFRT